MCDLCRNKLVPSLLGCPFCQKKESQGMVHQKCVRPNSLDGLVSLYYYNKTMKAFLYAVKYKLAQSEIHRFLQESNIFTERVLTLQKLKLDAVVPVPLHSTRKNRRGFNQSDIVARIVSQKLSIPQLDLVVRTKKTPPLAQSASKLHRFASIQRSFELKKSIPLSLKRILLVDDVYTTGATTKEVIKTIKKHSQTKVFVFVLAQN